MGRRENVQRDVRAACARARATGEVQELRFEGRVRGLDAWVDEVRAEEVLRDLNDPSGVRRVRLLSAGAAQVVQVEPRGGPRPAPARPPPPAPERPPNLVAVLACLSGWTPAVVEDHLAGRLREDGAPQPPLCVPRRFDDASEFWEALVARGLVPSDWASNPRRAFSGMYPCHGCPAGRPYDCRDCEGTHRAPDTRPYPASVEFVVALAADPRRVATCEALASEAAARLVPWGADADANAGVLWIAARDPWLAVTGSLAAQAVEYSVAVALRCAPERGDAVPLPPRLDALAARWAEAARRGLRVQRRGRADLAAVGRRFADLPDPYAPLRDLAARGVAASCPKLGPTKLYAAELA